MMPHMGLETPLGKLPGETTVECQRRNQEMTEGTAGQQHEPAWPRPGVKKVSRESGQGLPRRGVRPQGAAEELGRKEN